MEYKLKSTRHAKCLLHAHIIFTLVFLLKKKYKRLNINYGVFYVKENQKNEIS